ncbi:MAG: outer membrane protein assembly factor BamD [Bacteroidales bacterium]|nr:outer membrane protein assembly factor BamD [Bacteroidales bacterium]
MVKNSIKILIFMLIATVSYAYSAERPALERPDYEQEWGKRDSLRKVKRDYRAQDKLTKKVTFETFEQNYAKAMRFYQKQQYLSAASLFEELYPISLGTPRADTILFLFAHSYYMNKDYTMAAFHFRDYVRRYPNSERTPEAFFYCISAIYESSPDYYLDQSNTEYAIEQIKAFVQAYPENQHIEDCNRMLDELRLKLARKDLEALKLYYNTDHFEACQIAAKNFFVEYSYSPLMPEAIYYLVLNNLEYARKSVSAKQEERYKACLEACRKMELEYPNSNYMKEVSKIASDVTKILEKIQSKSN